MNFIKPYKQFLSCFIIVTLAFFKIIHAQNSPYDYLRFHNVARAAVGVGKIKWDYKIAAYAKQCAKERIHDCALQPSTGPYGENLAVGSGEFMTGAAAVQMWIGEQAYYDNNNNNTCAEGHQCGEYTQVIWKDSVRLGCARVQCYDESYFVACNYDPPGNFFGEKPY